jgi:deoxyribonuclease-4
MAGQGTQVGYRFEQLGRILRATDDSPRLGVCFDTCHAFAAGYELRTPDGYEATLDAFEAQIGLARLRLLHLNDSEGGLGSRVDRHGHIGAGALGCDGFARLLNDSRLAGLAGVLETDPAPDLQGHREDLARLRGLLPNTRHQAAHTSASPG